MSMDVKQKFANITIMEKAVLIAVLIVLSALSFRSYVLFHTLDELFCVLISFGVVLVTLYTPVEKDSFLFLIGIAYGFVGAFDLVHTLAYNGMGVFPGDTSNLATQLWICARFLQAGSLFIAALLIGKKVDSRISLLSVTSISIFLGSAIIVGVFPDCFIPGSGLTLFKKVSEYIIILLLIASVVILHRQQKEKNEDSEVYHNLIKACITSIFAESFFTLYVSVYGLENMIGHLLKLLSFYYIYKAFIEAYLWLPYVEALKRLKAEEALRESDKKLRESMAMLERAQRIRGVGYWTLNLANKELKWSPQARSIYVGDADFDLTYESALKLTHPEDLANVKANIRKAIMQKLPTEIEHRIIRPGGSEAIVNLDMEMDIDHDGQIVRLFGTIVDVTKQRKAEAAQREIAERLMALDKLKDQFLANTTHELKTPLNAIIGISESLSEDISEKLSSEQQEHLSIISLSARRLSNLINDILDISQLKNGDIKLNKKAVRISDIIRHLRLAFEYLNHKKEVTMRWNIPEDLPLVVVDEDRIKQVLYNLLDNALKFTEQGEITTSVSVEEDMLTVSIMDTGIGIAKDKHEDIFKAFYQIEDPLTRNNSGIGLGLSIIKQIIQLHGSKLMLESEENKGSKFSFTLPVFHGQATDDYQIEEVMTKRYNDKRELTELPANFTQNENQILIVDDDYANLQAAIITLRKEGYSIAVATNGQKALEMIDSNPNLCLVILDLMLPGMNGYDVCRIIRSTKDYHVLPILMLTGRSYTDSILMGFDAGVNDFLAKPFEPGELKARVRTLIELRKSVHRTLRTEIKFLQSQIKPHFIHNALNTIISISRKDHDRAILLLVEFSNYLRGCFEHENLEDSISIEMEMSLIQSYIAIEKARWGEKIKIQYHIENKDIAIPPLIIQPIVENCVVHGLRAKPEGGTIIVSVQSTTEKIIITIQDDGLGMSEEKVASLLSDNMVTRGVGLNNINQRLRKLYGAQLSIKSELNKGTLIKMEIPYKGGVL